MVSAVTNSKIAKACTYLQYTAQWSIMKCVIASWILNECHAI